MAFEETTLKPKTPRADVMASIGGSKPESLTLTLSFSAGCAAQLGISDTDRMKVLVGTEKDEGSIRLVPDREGAFRALQFRRNGIIVVRCGHHPTFVKPREKAACPEFARIEKGKVIEIKLPAAWPEKPFRNGCGAGAHKTPRSTPPPEQANSTEPTPAGKPAPTPERAAPTAKLSGTITEHGVTICFARNAENVSYGKKTIDATARQAVAVAALAKSFGKSVGRSWLMNELWPGKPAHEVHRDFDILIRDLSIELPKIGLMLVKGDGYALMANRSGKA